VESRVEVKLLDFGLAHLNGATTLTPIAGVGLGTWLFAGPEQLASPHDVGPSADIYAVGAVIFWMLTGEAPLPQPHFGKGVLLRNPSTIDV
jgi:serine/threonine-protein kinase